MFANKKVIFVGGADFSGTTMLDLMLGSIEGGFSMGEVYAFFWPTHSRHLTPYCSCGNDSCMIWDKTSLKAHWELYRFFFRKYPHISYLVDSSKSVAWIARQSRFLRGQNIEVKHVLIWKHPEDYSRSCARRGRLKNWSNRWIQYHRAYLYTVSETYVIQLNDLLDNFDQEMPALCDSLGVKYQKSMFEYWNKEHHCLFGSATAKIRLHQKGTNAWENIKESSSRSDLVVEEGRSFEENTPQIPDKHQNSIMNIISILRKNGPKELNNRPKVWGVDYYRTWTSLLLKRAYFRIRE